MTPTARIFSELFDIVARAYELDIDALSTEEKWPAPPVREARQVVCLVAHEVLKLTQARIGRFMQRDHRSVSQAVGAIRKKLPGDPVLRLVVEQVSQRLREYVRHFDVFEPSEAAE
jgi:chromosomal replication initiation ATPase DnaA